MELFTVLFMALTTIPRDLKMTYDTAETMTRVNYWSWKDRTVFQLFDEVVKHQKYNIAFRRGFDTWSFHMVQEYSFKIASYFHLAGLQRGDVVGLAGVEGPQSVALWLGISRLGAVTALLPSDLAPADMVQAASKVYSKAIICTPELATGLTQQKLPNYMSILSLGPTQDKSVKNIIREVDGSSSKPLKHNMSVNNKLLYLFSPKTLIPRPVTHYRYIYIATNIRKSLDFTAKDIIYSPMPQSTADGSIVAAGQTILFGNLVVSGGKPTIDTYFKDCDHYGATIAMYDAEIVKGLMASSSTEMDKHHKVRLLTGNGLQNPQTWTELKERFNIHHIGQYHIIVDSDGRNLVNSYGKPGAIGFVPWYFSGQKVKLVALDPNTGEVVRKQNRLCKSPAKDQPGILIEEMPKDFVRVQFSKNKKVISDVYRKGDKYINTGEILKKDEKGYYYYMGQIEDFKVKTQS
ncbi:long-chain fatty acid transport protein 4-like [Macrosteles quadrilineatus]|uniref:long-chain fatty acid transport protein 4-like n=1 Tax=Macrosteles quadrilineatus TaxID=74068 RepID=UPI0023E3318F|nr:long-chain fatty acid transport protein 4-like [Macrosteles quadrilineatus]